MKRQIKLASIGKPSAILELELEEKSQGPVFTVSGEIKNHGFGQCIDEIAELYPEPLVLTILNLWKKYHLNDMNPDCEHGINEKLGDKKITINTYCLNLETLRLRRRIEDDSKIALLNGETVKLSKEDRFLLNLEYQIKDNQFNEDIAKYYKLEKTEEKDARWVFSEEHPDGILGKPCPVCGYKYGTAWNYRAIPAEDLALIKEIISGGKK